MPISLFYISRMPTVSSLETGASAVIVMFAYMNPNIDIWEMHAI